MKDRTIRSAIQALGVTSDWENSPMSIYVDDWENIPMLTQTSINSILTGANYTFDHDEEL